MSADGDIYCSNFTIVDDDSFEGDETFPVVLRVMIMNGAITIGTDETAVTIIDDDGES